MMPDSDDDGAFVVFSFLALVLIALIFKGAFCDKTISENVAAFVSASTASVLIGVFLFEWWWEGEVTRNLKPNEE